MAKQITDHLGNVFSSFIGLCDYYGIKEATLRRRLKEGWTLKEALTTKCRHVNGTMKAVYDHFGECYESERAMCKHYGINVSTYRSRVRTYKNSICDALTLPVDKQYHSRQCTDHMGNKYHSILDMCKHYGVNRNKYKQRINLGWTLKDALTRH